MERGKYGIKPVVFFVLLLAIAILTGGCTPKMYVDEKKEAAIAQADLIMEAIEKKDPDGLVALFSEYAARTYDLETEAEELMDFIDGNVISVGEVLEFSREKDYRVDGNGYDHFSMNIYEIRTDTSGEYVIAYDYFIGDYLERQKNGTNSIWIGDRAAYSVENGYAQSGTREMGIK